MSLNKKSILLILVSVVISAASAKQLSAVGPIRIKSDDQLYCRIVPCTVECYTKSANSVAMRVGHRCRVEFAVCHINSMQQFLGSNGDLWSDYEFQQWYPYPTSVPLIKVSQRSNIFTNIHTREKDFIYFSGDYRPTSRTNNSGV